MKITASRTVDGSDTQMSIVIDDTTSALALEVMSMSPPHISELDLQAPINRIFIEVDSDAMFVYPFNDDDNIPSALSELFSYADVQ